MIRRRQNEPPTAAARDDCPLPAAVQRRNIVCFVAFQCLYFLSAPVLYVGPVHANLLKTLGSSDTTANLPLSAYLWLTCTPLLAAWLFPRPRHLLPLISAGLCLMLAGTAAVALALGLGAASGVVTAVVIAHGAIIGAANGVAITAMWDCLRRGISTARRGVVLGFTFGIGPLFACGGALFQDALFEGRLLGGRTFGVAFPWNYAWMFAAVVPVLLLLVATMRAFTLPDSAPEETGAGSPLAEIGAGFRQFARHRPVWFAVLIYILVYSGGYGIIDNISLHAITLLGADTDTQGAQNFLRFGGKAVCGAALGWLLASTSPRAPLFATTALLLCGMVWALGIGGWWFLAVFVLLGAGGLFGAYFSNYITTASAAPYVRVNLAILSLLTPLIGFSPLAFGAISDAHGRRASFQVAAGILVLALALIGLLPADPAPRETSNLQSA